VIFQRSDRVDATGIVRAVEAGLRWDGPFVAKLLVKRLQHASRRGAKRIDPDSHTAEY